MSLISTFVDAFKRAAGKKPEVDPKTYGPMGSTTQEGGKAFDPLRRVPQPGRPGQAPGVDDRAVASSDPEEGGEGKRV